MKTFVLVTTLVVAQCGLPAVLSGAEIEQSSLPIQLGIHLDSSWVVEGEPVVVVVSATNAGDKPLAHANLMPQVFRESTVIRFEIRRGPGMLPSLEAESSGARVISDSYTSQPLAPGAAVTAKKTLVPLDRKGGRYLFAVPGRYEIRAVVQIGASVLESCWMRFGVRQYENPDRDRLVSFAARDDLIAHLMGSYGAPNPALSSLVREIRMVNRDSPYLVHLEYRALAAASTYEERMNRTRAYLARYEHSPFRDDALFALARQAEIEGELEAAAEHYVRLVEDVPDSGLVIEAKRKLEKIEDQTAVSK